MTVFWLYQKLFFNLANSVDSICLNPLPYLSNWKATNHLPNSWLLSTCRDNYFFSAHDVAFAKNGLTRHCGSFTPWFLDVFSGVLVVNRLMNFQANMIIRSNRILWMRTNYVPFIQVPKPLYFRVLKVTFVYLKRFLWTSLRLSSRINTMYNNQKTRNINEKWTMNEDVSPCIS